MYIITYQIILLRRKEAMRYEGYHGTNLVNAPLILQSNFHISCNDNEWLGSGAYFYLHGVSDPQDDAKNWSILQSYDSKKKTNSYTNYAVIKAEISAENVMHLDTDEGVKAFNFFRDEIIKLIASKGLTVSRSAFVNDCKICNFAMSHAGYDAIVNREYIKLDSWSRINHYQSRVPTCKIICVKDPHKSINIDLLAIVEQGSCI